MSSTLYTAEAHVTGRANGHDRTSDGVLEVDLRLPVEMGGQGDGTNPEELFAVGYAACFEGALGTVARRAKEQTGDLAIDSRVMLGTTEERGSIGPRPGEITSLRSRSTGPPAQRRCTR
jgi:lipoyl-dependent peroxiredoxin